LKPELDYMKYRKELESNHNLELANAKKHA